MVATKKDSSYLVLKDQAIDKVYYVDCSKLSFNIKNQIKNIKAYKKIIEILKNEKITLAYGFGGYISGIGILASKIMKLKTYIHEQNSVMGKANLLISKYVDKVFLSFPIKPMRKNYLLVGSPVYINAVNIKKNIYKERNKILFTSGTLGARTINNLAINLINRGYLDNFDIYLITGKVYYDDCLKRIKKENINIIPFSNSLITDIASSNIVVSRGGSSTLFEIIGTKSLGIIIPSPNVTNNHQYHNAQYFKNMELIEVIEENDLSIVNFMDKLNTLIKKRNEYIDNLNKFNENNIYEYMIDGVIYEKTIL